MMKHRNKYRNIEYTISIECHKTTLEGGENKKKFAKFIIL